jgi:cell division protein FtsB
MYKITSFYKKGELVNLPQFPTDNLYKFIALSGVAIIILSMYFPNMLALQYYEADAKLDLEIHKAKAELDFSKKEVKTLEQIVDNYNFGKTEENSRLEGKLSLFYSREEIKKKYERLNELIKEADIKDAEIQKLQSHVKTLWTLHRRILYVSYASDFLGWLLAFFGFYLWYKRVQIYHDKILKRESLKGDG